MTSQSPRSNPNLILKAQAVSRFSGENLGQVAGGHANPDGGRGAVPQTGEVGPSEASCTITNIYCGWWSLSRK